MDKQKNPEWWKDELFRWIEHTRWPTIEADTRLAFKVYEQWKTRSDVPQYAGYRCLEKLMEMIRTVLLERHNYHDASMITVALIAPITLKARREGYARQIPIQ